MGLLTHMRNAKSSAIQKSINGRQEKAKKLLDRLKWLYDTVIIVPDQSDAIKMLHVQYAQRSRELMEKFTQEEIDILEDKYGKYKGSLITSETKLNCLGCGKVVDMKHFYKDESGGIWCNDCWFKSLKNK